MQSSSAATNSPGFIGYLCALGGLFAVIAVIGVVSILVHATVQLGALAGLEASIASGRLLESRYHLNRIFYPPKLFSWLLIKRESPAFKTKRDYQLEALLKVLTFADASNFRAARDALSTLNEEALLRITGAKSSSTSLVDQVRDLLAKAENAQIFLKDNDAELDSLRGLEQRYRTEFTNLGKQFGDLLSLQAEAADSFPVYSKGVLHGLPRLKHLDDEIADLITLRTLLTELGGEVKVEGPNPHEVFTAKLNELRGSTQALNADMVDVEAKLEQLKTAHLVLSKQGEFELLNLRAGIFSILSLATNRAIDPNFFKTLGYLPNF